MGERVNGIHEVRGSIPLASTADGRSGRLAVGRINPTERLHLGGTRE